MLSTIDTILKLEFLIVTGCTLVLIHAVWTLRPKATNDIFVKLRAWARLGLVQSCWIIYMGLRVWRAAHPQATEISIQSSDFNDPVVLLFLGLVPIELVVGMIIRHPGNPVFGGASRIVTFVVSTSFFISVGVFGLVLSLLDKNIGFTIVMSALSIFMQVLNYPRSKALNQTP